MTPWLSQAEVDDLCHPLTQAAAQHRYLRSLGLTVKSKPSGAPLVLRSEVERLGTPTTAAKKEQTKCQPDEQALLKLWSKAA